MSQVLTFLFLAVTFILLLVNSINHLPDYILWTILLILTAVMQFKSQAFYWWQLRTTKWLSGEDAAELKRLLIDYTLYFTFSVTFFSSLMCII